MISDKDGMTLLYVSAGEFIMGSNNGDSDEKPVHKVILDAFWIDKTEVPNVMFAMFVNETGYTTDAEKTGRSWVYQGSDWNQIDGAAWSHPLGPSSGISNIMNRPVVHVSWNDAQTYCSWANRRLPTEAEWEKAARGEYAFIYPWGSEEPNNNLLNYNINIGDTTEVGKYPNGASPYGVLDMAGNVWEFVYDWYGGDYYSYSPASNPPGPSNGNLYLLRGGSWYSVDKNIRTTYRRWWDAELTYSDVGFRCAIDATP